MNARRKAAETKAIGPGCLVLGFSPIFAVLIGLDMYSNSYFVWQLGMQVCAFSVNQHACICDNFGRAPPEGTPEFEAGVESVAMNIFLNKGLVAL